MIKNSLAILRPARNLVHDSHVTLEGNHIVESTEMPAITRSANKQTSLEDVGADKVKEGKSKTGAGPSKKRKSVEQAKGSDKSAKKAKNSQSENVGGDENSGESITINRAPVLELWGSCVTQFLYPSLSWSTCLSAGGAISTITAIAKGRSIGKIEKPDPGEAEKKRQERKKKAEKEKLKELETMSFKLSLDKDGQAMVAGKPKKAGEEALLKKYGGPEQYDKVRKTFDEALQSWKGKEEELDQRAFGMYEDFRPGIPPGQSGWGRKGQLNLETVKSAISGG